MSIIRLEEQRRIKSERDLLRPSSAGSRGPDGAQGDNLSLGKLPQPTERVKSAYVSKLCQGEWQSRYMVLTERDLILALPGSDEVSDRIPLHEIKSVTKMREDDNDILSDCSQVNAFNVHTLDNGYNCGRGYCFRVNSEEHYREWTKIVSVMSKMASRRNANRTLLQKYQMRARMATSSKVWQQTNSFLIIANLIVIIAQSQVLPLEGSRVMLVFDVLDIIFTALFAIELVINIFAYWFLQFFTDWWFGFDFLVVTISVASLIFQNLPGVSILRLMRTFRVLRLFNKMRSLRIIINALASSLIPVINALLMLLLICVVYSILGVQLFGQQHPEYFGDFAVSCWTLFQITTLDGWSDKAKDLSSTDTFGVDPVVACFMATYIGLSCWVMLPVLVAVLLDNFIGAVTSEKYKVHREQEAAQLLALGMSRADGSNPLDPLLESLSRFRNAEDLTRRINKLFKVLDADLGGTLNFREIQEGLKKLDHFEPRIHLSIDDYQKMTKYGARCDPDGEISPEAFEAILRDEVKEYIRARVAAAHEETLLDEEPGATSAVLASMKWMLISDDLAPAASDHPPDHDADPPGKHGKDDSGNQGHLQAHEVFHRELQLLRSDMRCAIAEIHEVRREMRRGRDGPSAWLPGVAPSAARRLALRRLRGAGHAASRPAAAGAAAVGSGSTGRDTPTAASPTVVTASSGETDGGGGRDLRSYRDAGGATAALAAGSPPRAIEADGRTFPALANPMPVSPPKSPNGGFVTEAHRSRDKMQALMRRADTVIVRDFLAGPIVSPAAAGRRGSASHARRRTSDGALSGVTVGDGAEVGAAAPSESPARLQPPHVQPNSAAGRPPARDPPPPPELPQAAAAGGPQIGDGDPPAVGVPTTSTAPRLGAASPSGASDESQEDRPDRLGGSGLVSATFAIASFKFNHDVSNWKDRTWERCGGDAASGSRGAGAESEPHAAATAIPSQFSGGGALEAPAAVIVVPVTE